MNLPIKPLALVALAACTNSCATALVRSNDSPPSIYPATQLDAEAIWESGVLGGPIFPMPHGERNNIPGRIMITLGGLIDLPISLAIDTVLLPFDLYHVASPARDEEEGE